MRKQITGGTALEQGQRCDVDHGDADAQQPEQGECSGLGGQQGKQNEWDSPEQQAEPEVSPMASSAHPREHDRPSTRSCPRRRRPSTCRGLR